MVFTAQLGREHQVGHCRVRSLGEDLNFELSFYFGFGFDNLSSRTNITLPLGFLQIKNKQLRG